MQDLLKTIIFIHIVKDYSLLLFTVKQDTHEADFECNDLLYRAQ